MCESVSPLPVLLSSAAFPLAVPVSSGVAYQQFKSGIDGPILFGGEGVGSRIMAVVTAATADQYLNQEIVSVIWIASILRLREP